MLKREKKVEKLERYEMGIVALTAKGMVIHSRTIEMDNGEEARIGKSWISHICRQGNVQLMMIKAIGGICK